MTHVRHIGFALDAARLLIRGWRLLGCAEPTSPVCEIDAWLAIGPCPVPRRTP